MKDARSKSGTLPTDPSVARRSMALVLSGTSLVVLVTVLGGSWWAPDWLKYSQPVLLALALLLIYASWWQYRRLLGAVASPLTASAPASRFFESDHLPQTLGVIVDGERWDSPEGGARLILEVAAGQHRIEVRKDGFKPYSTTIQVRPGETQTVNVSLPPGGGSQ